jgi:hypothetical protein
MPRDGEGCGGQPRAVAERPRAFAATGVRVLRIGQKSGAGVRAGTEPDVDVRRSFEELPHQAAEPQPALQRLFLCGRLWES